MSWTRGKASRQAQAELTALLEAVRVELAATRADGSATVAMLRRELRARDAERTALLDAVVRLAGSMASLAEPHANGALSVGSSNGVGTSSVIGGSVTPDQNVIALATDDFLVQDGSEEEIVLDDESSAAVAATIQAAVGLASQVTSGVMTAPPTSFATTADLLPIEVPTNGATASGAVAEALECSGEPALAGAVGVASEELSPHVPHGAVEVRCRFGDKWVDGFEICEIVRTGGRVRYRLRRLLDGCVLPELFNAADVRCFDAPYDGS